jgi:polyhydroxybutyrate depolymerase
MTAMLPLTFLALALQPGALDPGDHTRSLTVGGRKRTYLVHVPKACDGKKACPVVLAYHGGGSNAEQMARFCGLNETADKAGFIVVYPNGTGRLAKLLTWNGGNCCGYAMLNKVDDVAFTKALLDDLAKVAKIDPKRVYATGMSNGAIMAYRLASELSDRIAAIAPVAGPMGAKECRPKRAVPVIHFHGTKDEFAPFAGGRGAKSISGTDFYSVDHSIRAWVKANGCKEKPEKVDLPNKAKDGTRTTRTTYGSGKNNSEVVLVTIEGGGHTWPGRVPRLEVLGKATKNVSANEMMWEFFKKHPMKGSFSEGRLRKAGRWTVCRPEQTANSEGAVCQRKATVEDRQGHPPDLAIWQARCFACRKARADRPLRRPDEFATDFFVADWMRCWAPGATVPPAHRETLPPGDEVVRLCPASLRKSPMK